MPSDLSDPTIFIHVASLTLIIAYAIRRQLYLRLVALISTAMYIMFYVQVPGGPLVVPIYWNLLVIAVNLTMIFVLVRDELTIGMPDDERALLAEFQVLNPGKFRKLMKIAEHCRASANMVVLTEGEETDRLYYLVDGEAEVRKNDKRIRLSRGSFLGEVAFLTGMPATATVVLLPGANCIVFDTGRLAELMNRDPMIDIAVRGLFNRDMALKVANSSLS